MREWFDGDAYSFRRLSKLDNSDIQRLARRLWLQRWRKANPERKKEYEREHYARVKANPARYAKLLKAVRLRNRRRRENPAYVARTREYARKLARRIYAQTKAATEKRAKYAALLADAGRRSKEQYARAKADPALMARRRELQRLAQMRRMADPAYREKRNTTRRAQYAARKAQP